MFNIVIVLVAILLALVVFITGAVLMLQNFWRFRYQVRESMAVDLELIKVSKPMKKGEEGDGERWKEEIGSMEQLLQSLSTVRNKAPLLRRLIIGEPAITMEIANPSNSEEIFFYMAIPRLLRESFEKQVSSYFPNSSIQKVSDYTIFSPQSYGVSSVLKLKRSSALPVKTYETMNVDPLNDISNALSKLKNVEEGAAIQLLLTPAGSGWRNEGRSIAHKMQQGKQLKDVYSDSLSSKAMKEVGGMTKDLFKATSKQGAQMPTQPEQVQLTPEEQELVKSVEAKSNEVGFKVNLRLVASAESPQRAQEILGQLENAFSQFQNSDFNMFQIKRRGKNDKDMMNYIFRTPKDDDAFVLTTNEIASLYHFPISTTQTPYIKMLKSAEAPAPTNIPDEGILLGYNDYRGVDTPIRLSDNDRRRHLYVIGQTGVGKSNLLTEMAKQDVREGRGICTIDPHGDFAEDVITAIPKERAEDLIYFDPSDIERPIGLNMLEYERPEEKTFVVNEMIGIFDKLYDMKSAGGPMFEQYMRNSMLLVMDDPSTGSTLMEIPKILADENFRKMKLAKCQNIVVKEFWEKEAEKAGGEASLANMVPYITSKLTTFISNDMMRPIIAQQKSAINFRQAMDEGKIILVNLSKGKLGEINAYLLGMIIVGKILMAALSRVNIPEEERRDFYLYIDEFQNVTTDSISQILSEARKYRLSLNIAHQFIGQLSDDISKAVFGNVGSLASFRVGPEDAEFLEKQFGPTFSAHDLANVDNYQCFAKLLMNGEVQKPFNMKTYPPTRGDQELANHMKELSRLKYGKDVNIINREILERTKFVAEPEGVGDEDEDLLF